MATQFYRSRCVSTSRFVGFWLDSMCQEQSCRLNFSLFSYNITALPGLACAVQDSHDPGFRFARSVTDCSDNPFKKRVQSFCAPSTAPFGMLEAGRTKVLLSDGHAIAWLHEIVRDWVTVVIHDVHEYCSWFQEVQSFDMNLWFLHTLF